MVGRPGAFEGGKLEMGGSDEGLFVGHPVDGGAVCGLDGFTDRERVGTFVGCSGVSEGGSEDVG